MDTDSSNHPTRETLQAYSLGKLDDVAARLVTEHLKDCSDCWTQFTELAPHELTLDSSSAPRMSSTGQIDATSDALNKKDDASLQLGTRVGYFGDYELQKVIGEGGMGIVYKARQLSLNRLVALKMIKASRFPSTDEVRRFQNEAEAVARLDHPNIVPIFEVGRFEDQHYFSMKLITGESLDRRLKDYVADPRRAARLAAVVADAIHHAHQRGILHRDLKPANILIDSDGQPHVTDFGLAKRVEGDSELTCSGAIVGTPAYMAPEQASAKKGTITTATDVYGLGAILYALLTGRAPFGGTGVLETLEQVRERPADSPRKTNPRVPRDLDVICLKCLEKDPRRRYKSADALAGDVSRWLNGEPVDARLPTLRYLLGKALRRHRIAITLTVAILLTAVFGTVAAVAISAAVSIERSRRNAVLARERADQATAGEQSARVAEAEAGRKIEGLKDELRSRLVEQVDFANGAQLINHGDFLGTLAWFADALRLAEGDPRGEEIARSRLISTLARCPSLTQVVFHDECVADARFSLDGGRIVTASADKTARVWDAHTGQPITAPLQHKGLPFHASFSADGRRVLTLSRDATGPEGPTLTTLMWDAKSGEPIELSRDESGRAVGVPLSYDGMRVMIVGFDRAWRVWDAGSGKPASPPIVGLGWELLSPDGRRTFTVGLKGMLRTLDANSGCRELNPLVNAGSVLDASFSSLGPLVLAASDGHTATVWDVDSRLPISPPLNHKGAVHHGSLGFDGLLAVTTGDDGACVWDTLSGQPLSPPLDRENVVRASLSRDGLRVVTACRDGTARIWNVAPRRAIPPPLRHQGPVWHASFSADGRRVLTASHDNTARVWDSFSGQPISPPLVYDDWEVSQAVSRDGRYLVVGGLQGTAQVSDAKSGNSISRRMKHGAWIVAAAFSPDSRRVVTASYDGTARVWDASSGEPITAPLKPEHAVTANGPFRATHARFSPDGRCVLTAGGRNGGEGEARVWDAHSGKPITPTLKHDLAVQYAEFSPDGRCVITGSGSFWADARSAGEGEGGGEARVWDASSGQAISPPLKHKARVSHVAFSPDSRWVVTASADKTARVWDARSGEPISPPLEHEASVNDARFSPDGRRVATASNDFTARVWEVLSEESTSPLWTYPSHDLIELARLLGSTHVDSHGELLPLKREESRAQWSTLRDRYPEFFARSPDFFLAWHWREAAACERAQAWQLAIGHLAALIRANPHNWILYSRRGRAFSLLGRWNEAVADYSQAIELRPVEEALWKYERLFSERADLYAEMGRWPAAASDFSEACALDPRDVEARIGLYLISLSNDDLSGFRESCARLLRDFMPSYRRELILREFRWTSYEPELIVNLVAACNSVPIGARDGEIVLRLSRLAPFADGIPGAAKFRVGNLADGVKELTRALQDLADEGDGALDGGGVKSGRAVSFGIRADGAAVRLFLALAHQRLGHIKEARECLHEATSAIDEETRPDATPASSRPRLRWRDRLVLGTLRREAEAVIIYDPIFPANVFAR
jgi:eukaryotic-like serine/threonine-protein kinase